ncbi:MAG: M28 family metallopeptidase [Candidatus Hodarchaeota archaeon]
MDEAVKYELGFIKKILDATGPRLATTPQERQAAMIIKEEFSEITGKEAIVEQFKCAPHASIGAIPLLGYIMLFALTPLYFTSPVGTIILGLFLLAFFLVQIIKYKGWFDFLFPKRTSQNVYAAIEPPSGKVDYSIFFSGHVDSSWDWRLVRRWPKSIYIMVPWGVLSAIMMVFFSLLRILDQLGILIFTGAWLYWIVIAFLPGFIYIALFFSWKNENASPGAMDDLTGIAVVAHMGRYYTANPGKIPRNCRIVLLATGAEECGLKGSANFVKKHLDDILYNAYVINIDGVSDLEDFHVVDGDSWLGVNYDDEFCNLAVQAMEETGVKPATRAKNPVGGTDAASFTKKGVKALTSLAQHMEATDYYHTARDTIDRLDPESLNKMNEVMKRLVELIDKSRSQKSP